MMTIATLDEGEREFWEPGASPIRERLEVLKAFKARGIPVGVLMMPLLPMLWDREEQISTLLHHFAEIPVDFLLPGSLTLRPGIQRDVFIQGLETRAPEFVEEYRRLYGENRPSGNSRWDYRNRFYPRLLSTIQASRIPPHIPHRIYRRKISLADELLLLMLHMEDLYGYRGIDTRPLKAAREHYTRWLDPRRKEFNRRRSLSSDHIDEEIRWLARQKRWGSTLKNEKLGSLMEAVILENAVLDYPTLKRTGSKA